MPTTPALHLGQTDLILEEKLKASFKSYASERVQRVAWGHENKIWDKAPDEGKSSDSYVHSKPEQLHFGLIVVIKQCLLKLKFIIYENICS